MNKTTDQVIIELLEIQNKLKNNIISNLETLEDVEILRLVNAIIKEANKINEKNHRRVILFCFLLFNIYHSLFYLLYQLILRIIKFNQKKEILFSIPMFLFYCF